MGLVALTGGATASVSVRRSNAVPDALGAFGLHSTTTEFTIPSPRATVAAPALAPATVSRRAVSPTTPPSVTATVDSTAPPAGSTLPGAFVDLLAAVNGGGVLFGYREDHLGTAAAVLLDRLAAALPPGPQPVLALRGHTDSTGDANDNLLLSRRRARAMADRLVAAGVPRSRLVVVGVGHGEPAADDQTEAGRAANRRGEILLELSP